MLKWVFYISVFLFLLSCKEPYFYTTNHVEKVFVVEGRVVGEKSESFIKLSTSGDINDYRDSVISGAVVTVIENESNLISFNEIQKGIYRPDSNFEANYSNSYQLKIEYGGEQYESDLVFMEQSLPIEEISFTENADELTKYTIGNAKVKFNISSGINKNASKYYTYAFQETYLVKNQLNLDFKLDINDYNVTDTFFYADVVFYARDSVWETTEFSFYCLADSAWAAVNEVPYEVIEAYADSVAGFTVFSINVSRNRIVRKVQQITDFTIDTVVLNYPEACYNSYSNNPHNIHTTQNLTVNKFINEQVFTTSLDHKFQQRYSLLIKQYSISAKAYKFLNTIREYVKGSVPLYVNQPGFVQGNIKCVTNNEIKVLGVFYASSVKTNRVYIDNYKLSREAQEIVRLLTFECNRFSVFVPVVDTFLTSVKALRDTNPEAFKIHLNNRRILQSQGIKELLDTMNATYTIAYDRVLTDRLVGDVHNMGYDFFLAREYCANCSIFGDSIKPPFWTDY